MDQFASKQHIQQIQMMDIIYAYASLTVVAASIQKASDGLPGVSTKFTTSQQDEERIDGIEFLSFVESSVTLLNRSTYFIRAWTMQEVLLSKCRLVFTDRQVYFICNRASFCEDMDERNNSASYLEVAEPREFWLRMQDSDKR